MSRADRQWAGRRVWITGASSGIGEALACRLAAAGAQVFASARRAPGLAALADRQPGIVPVPLDVTDAAACRAAAATIGAQASALDALILSAGVCEYLDADALDTRAFGQTLQVNLLGAVHAVAAALPLLRAGQAPQLIGISSLATQLPFTRAEAYGASKAGLDYFLASLAVDLAPMIRVRIVAPGFVATPMTAANTFAMPQQISVDTAVEALLRGLAGRRTVISFPRRLAWPLHLLARLPLGWRIALGRYLARGSVA